MSTNRRAGDFQHHPDYDALPESIKAMYSPKEYAWLPDALKSTLIEDETMPEEDAFD